MNLIYKVKVSRNLIVHFPFDLIYLVHFDIRYLLPKLFPASLCFPIEDQLKALVLSLWSKSAKHCIDAYCMERQTKKKRTVLAEAIPVDQLEMFFLVVPVMLETVITNERKESDTGTVCIESKHRGPKYITAEQHVRLTSNKFSEIFTHATVFFTPRGPIRPICLACPRHMLQSQGKCQLGGKECYQWLTLQREPADYIEEAENEQLPEHGTNNDNATSE